MPDGRLPCEWVESGQLPAFQAFLLPLPATLSRFQKPLDSARQNVRGWLFAGVDLLAPPGCAGCGRTGAAWCRECDSRTARIGADCCEVCGAPGSEKHCHSCSEYAAVFHRARAYAVYTEPFKYALLRLKHHEDRALGDLLAGLAMTAVLPVSDGADLVVPVPLSARKQAARGFNQVDLVARPLAARLGIPHLSGALVRTRETRSQVGLSGTQRRQNLAKAFQADPDLVAGKAVLLIDDVFTTGTTGNACARALLRAGAARVNLFTLARAVGPPEEITEIA